MLAPATGKVSGKEEEQDNNLKRIVCLFPFCVSRQNSTLSKKYRTEEQTKTAQARAVRFAENVLKDSDLASELEDLTPAEYADRRGIEIVNPLKRRTTNMANGNGGNGATKADLQDVCDEVQQTLESAYTPEASREDLAAAVGDALAILDPDTYGDDEDDADDTDGDDDQS